MATLLYHNLFVSAVRINHGNITGYTASDYARDAADRINIDAENARCNGYYDDDAEMQKFSYEFLEREIEKCNNFFRSHLIIESESEYIDCDDE